MDNIIYGDYSTYIGTLKYISCHYDPVVVVHNGNKKNESRCDEMYIVRQRMNEI